MKNERGTPMKRVLCVLLALCVLPVFANASPFDSFCGYVYAIGKTDFDDSQKTVKDGRDVYTTATGLVVFQLDSGTLKTISVCGYGDEFLVNVFAAICTVEGGATNLLDNYSEFMMRYFEAHTGEKQTSMTKGGFVYIVRPFNDGYMFIISR